MIAGLRGTVGEHLGDGVVVLEVQGVGYEVHLATPTPPTAGETIAVAVYTAVRDDAIVLYGFATYAERALFGTLLATPGVGPSTALAALRTLTRERLVAAIDAGDVATLTLVPGIGAKTAQRIVLELRGKVTDAGDSIGPDVREALQRLGYGPADLRRLEGVELPSDEAEALREALRVMGRS